MASSGPGDVIRVDAVAEALGVSRIPVREALKILEEEIEEIYWLRALRRPRCRERPARKYPIYLILFP